MITNDKYTKTSIFPTNIILLICSYCDIYSCAKIMMTCKKYYKYFKKIPKMHNEFAYIDVKPLNEFLKKINLSDMIEKQNNNQEIFYEFEKSCEDLNSILEHHIIGHTSNYDYQADVYERNLTHIGFNKQNVYYMLNVIDNITIIFKRILMYHGKNKKNINAIIFKGKFHYFVLGVNFGYSPDKYNLIIDLNYKEKSNSFKYNKLLPYISFGIGMLIGFFINHQKKKR